MKSNSLTLLLGLLLTASVSRANSLTIEDAARTYFLESATQIAVDSLAGLEVNAESVVQFAQKLKFVPLVEAASNLESKQSYWTKILIRNDIPQGDSYTEWIMAISFSLTELEIFVEQPDGSFRKELNGIYRPHYLKTFVPRIEGSFVRITLPLQEDITIFIRGKNTRPAPPPDFHARIYHVTTFYEGTIGRKHQHAYYIGFLLMMLVYNIILYFFGRNRSFIYYSLYLLAMIIYPSYTTGALADWLQPTLFPNHPQLLYLSKFAIYLGIMAYIAFIRNFLNLSDLLPKWDRFFIYLFWLAVPWIIVDLIVTVRYNFSYAVADPITFIYILIYLLSTLIFAFYLFQTKDKKGYFIVAGILSLFLGIILSVLSWTQTPALNISYLKLGSVMEIIIFSLGLAYRQREEVKAKQQAYFQIEKERLVHEKEQEKIQRQKELSELKSQLYTNITHEFRTPLTIITGMNENIKNHPLEQQLIRRNSNHLLRLIDQLLHLSRAERVEIPLQKKVGDIIVYLQYLLKAFDLLATEKDIRLTFESEESQLAIMYDEQVVQHVFYNLISNAIKFTPMGGEVTLSVKQVIKNEKSLLEVSVTDTGIGIAPDSQQQIFDRFYQVKPSTLKSTSGSGIGLAIVKELVAKMKGEIKVNSSQQQGTQFIVRFPIEYAPVTTTLVDEVPSITTSFHELNTENEANKPTVLVIDDNQDIILYIQSILSQYYQIITAPNGQAGIDLALQRIPDLIISDVMMPQKNGYKVCKTLKMDERTSHIPIILLTAKSTQEDKLAGLKIGADAFLIKPFSKEELLIRLQQLLELRHKLQLKYANKNALQQSATTPDNRFLRRLQQHIVEHLSDTEYSVPQLATDLQLDRTQLYRKIKGLTGMSVAQYIRTFRLKRSKEMLLHSDANISEVAYSVGFSSPSYFSRSFQQEFGVSPRDYKNAKMV